MRFRWLVAPIALAPLLVDAPTSAVGCVPLAEQKPYSAFAGTVVQQRGDAYLFFVREVWSGPDLPERSWIRYEASGDDPPPSIGQPWVVFAAESFHANTCTATPDGKALDKIRPAKPRKATEPTWWSAIRTSLIGTSMLVPAQVIDQTD